MISIKGIWNFLIVYKLFVLNRNTWNYKTEQIICIKNSYLN